MVNQSELREQPIKKAFGNARRPCVNSPSLKTIYSHISCLISNMFYEIFNFFRVDPLKNSLHVDHLHLSVPIAVRVSFI